MSAVLQALPSDQHAISRGLGATATPAFGQRRWEGYGRSAVPGACNCREHRRLGRSISEPYEASPNRSPCPSPPFREPKSSGLTSTCLRSGCVVAESDRGARIRGCSSRGRRWPSGCRRGVRSPGERHADTSRAEDVRRPLSRRSGPILRLPSAGRRAFG
jgi:hypothetical protein